MSDSTNNPRACRTVADAPAVRVPIAVALAAVKEGFHAAGADQVDIVNVIRAFRSPGLQEVIVVFVGAHIKRRLAVRGDDSIQIDQVADAFGARSAIPVITMPPAL